MALPFAITTLLAVNPPQDPPDVHTGTIAVAFVDASGNTQQVSSAFPLPTAGGGGGGGGSTGSVTAAGTNGSLAQAVQGINGGVPMPTTSTDTTASGSITTSGNVAIASAGKGTVAFTVTGTWVGTIVIELFDGTNWNPTSYVALASGNAANSFTANTSGQINCIGYSQVRLRGATLSSGTANILFTASEKVATVMLDNSIPTGSNNIGSISNITGTVSLPTGAATAANQPPIFTTVSGSITTQNLVPTGAATAGSSVELTTQNFGTAQVQVTGTYTGALSLQMTVDGTNWITSSSSAFVLQTTYVASNTIASASVGIWKIDVSGYTKVRISGLAAMTGTAVVTINGEAGTGIPYVIANTGFISGTTATSNKGSSTAGAQRVAVCASAHSVASTENPVLVGGFVTSTIDTTLVQGDVGQLQMATGGQLLTKEGASGENDWYYAAATGGIVNSTAGVTAKAAGAASVRNYVRSATISCDALGAATELVINDGAAGTVMARIKLPITTFVQPFTVQFVPPLRGSAATLVEIKTLTATVTGGVFVNLQGYQGF